MKTKFSIALCALFIAIAGIVGCQKEEVKSVAGSPGANGMQNLRVKCCTHYHEGIPSCADCDPPIVMCCSCRCLRPVVFLNSDTVVAPILNGVITYSGVGTAVYTFYADSLGHWNDDAITTDGTYDVAISAEGYKNEYTTCTISDNGETSTDVIVGMEEN